MTNPDPIDALAETMLKPVREVGTLLAQAIDAVDTELRAIEAQLQELENSVKACCPEGLQRRVAELESRVNE